MDSLSSIEVFARVVEARSFTQAARRLGMTPSAISRAIARLEERLGVRLLQRTTRSFGLTEEGEAYYARCVRILAELKDAELALSAGREQPRGRLRVSAPVILGDNLLLPALPRFVRQWPDINVELSLRDPPVDLVAEEIDLMVHMGKLQESRLVCRHLGDCRVVMAGSPDYFAQHGRPKSPEELSRHSCLGYLAGGTPMDWRLRTPEGEVTLPVAGRVHVNNCEALRKAALAGLGITYLLEFNVAADLRSGALEQVLAEYEIEPRPIYAVYPRHRLLAPKVRAFVDFLVELFSARMDLAPRAPLPRRRQSG